MRNYLVATLMVLLCAAVLLVPAPSKAQASDVGLSIRVTPTTVAAGSTVGVIGYVTNNTSKKMRTSASFSSLSPCGIQTQIGYHRMALNPGQTMMLTATYPLTADACKGTYTVSISASGATTSTYLVVQ